MSQPFIGQITLFPYDYPPQGWADCQGQLLSISQNTALFSLLGTNFGGDGVRSFGLPDLACLEGMGLVAGGFADDARRKAGPVALADRNSTPQVRQGERRHAVATEFGSEQREQGLVLGDRHELSIAWRPASRRIAEGEDLDLAKEWSRHGSVLRAILDLSW